MKQILALGQTFSSLISAHLPVGGSCWFQTTEEDEGQIKDRFYVTLDLEHDIKSDSTQASSLRPLRSAFLTRGSTHSWIQRELVRVQRHKLE